MLVGLTYDLKSEYKSLGFSDEEIAEFDDETTIEGLEAALAHLGYQTERIGNIKSLVNRLHDGRKWDMVFNIAEGMYGSGREGQVPSLLDSYRIPYTFSGPNILNLSLNKAVTKTIIREAGIPTADFFVVNRKPDIAGINLKFPLFVKPLLEGTGKGISEKSLVKSKKELEETCLSILEVHKQPALVETYLPGREFTVGILGTGSEAKIVGAMEVVFNEDVQKIYSYKNKKEYEDKVRYQLETGKIGEECGELALRSWHVLECKDAGRVDVRLDDKGRPNFIEVNPLAGLNHIHSDLPIMARLAGIDYSHLIEGIMNSARKRHNM